MKEIKTKKYYNNNKNLLKFIIKLFNLKWKYKNEKVINNIKVILNIISSFKFD